MMNIPERITLLALVVLLAACSAPMSTLAPQATATQPPAESPVAYATITLAPTATPEPASTSTSQPAPLATVDLDDFKDLVYRIPGLAQAFPDTGGAVQLKDGVVDQPIPNSSASLHVELLNAARGDLNGDGAVDAAVVLVMQSGGSGTFYYLAALLDQGGTLVNHATTFLGDRVKISDISVDGSVVRMALTTHAPEDPMCCPTQDEIAEYVLIEDTLVPSVMTDAALQAFKGIQALRDKDMATLAALAHPTSGIRFSPYAYVHPEDLVFTPEQIAQLVADPTVYSWGAFDGSGEPIQMTYSQYHERFVYSRDFVDPDQVSFNQRIGTGNSTDNIQEFYPGSVVVEFYMSPKDPQYSGMDWQSLRLVMAPHDGQWYIIGIIHDEWTI